MMAGILFASAALLEAAILILRLLVKSRRARLAGWMRVCACALFALLTAAGVIPWDARFWPLGGLLLAQALFALARLLRKKGAEKPFRPFGGAARTFGALALIFLCAIPAILFPQSGIIPPTGRFQVASIAYTYTDAGRPETFSATDAYRRVNAAFWYPKGEQGKYPLVVFSHGGMSVNTSNESLYYELASNGYVVCSIDHPYHSMYTEYDDGESVYISGEYMRQLQKEDAKADRQQSFAYYQQWMSLRTDDMNFVIDTVLDKAEDATAGMPYSLVDGTRIGVMGHSLGGSAALGLGRQRKDIGAVIAMESPFMCDITGVEDGEFVFISDDYPAPVLNIYSGSSFANLAVWPQYAQNQRLMEKPQADSFYVNMQGVGHFSLTDLSLTSPLLTRLFNGFEASMRAEDCLKAIHRQCLQFFDSYLKKAGNYMGNR